MKKKSIKEVSKKMKALTKDKKKNVKGGGGGFTDLVIC